MDNLCVVDLHCHLDLYPDFLSEIAECERKGIHTLAVTTTPKAWPRNYSLLKNSSFIRPSLGLHPQLISQRAREINLFISLLPETRYVGEVGLDASPQFYKSIPTQVEVFKVILESCNRIGGKILSVHAVRTVPTILDLIEKTMTNNNCRVVMHWFSGSKTQLQRAIQLGCYFSINSEMFDKPDSKILVSQIPGNRILTETDGPFCKKEGKPKHPQDANDSVLLLAKMAGKPHREMLKQIIVNLDSLESF